MVSEFGVRGLRFEIWGAQSSASIGVPASPARHPQQRRCFLFLCFAFKLLFPSAQPFTSWRPGLERTDSPPSMKDPISLSWHHRVLGLRFTCRTEKQSRLLSRRADRQADSHTVLYDTILGRTILYYTVKYCTILCCTMHYTIYWTRIY